MTLHIVSVDQTPAQPWRNGGGQTRELLAWPGATDWQLRVSVADIDRDGPFSAFPGVQRWFAVLEGAGVVLGLPAGEAQLTLASPPCGFDGEAAPACRLLDGATRDLNLMSQRRHGEARMQPVLAGQPLAAGPAWRGLFTAQALRLRAGPDEWALPPLSLAWSAQDPHDWQLAGSGAPPRAWWLAFHRTPPRSETRP